MIRRNIKEDRELNDFLIGKLSNNLVYIHGIFAAAISGPTMIPPSEIANSTVLNEYIFDSEQEANWLISRLMNCYNSISTSLSKKQYNPINEFKRLYGDISEEELKQLAQIWSVGYVKGIEIRKITWKISDQEDEEKLSVLLMPIISLAHGEEALKKDISSLDIDVNINKLQDDMWGAFPNLANQIYYFWSDEREQLAREISATHYSDVSGVGRNDPCPCNSGKKYKKCCLKLH